MGARHQLKCLPNWRNLVHRCAVRGTAARRCAARIRPTCPAVQDIPAGRQASRSEYNRPSGPSNRSDCRLDFLYVNVETTQNPTIQNNRFQVLSVGNGNYQIQFVGGGAYNNYCIGDAGNLPGNADTGLVVCNTQTGGAGWGTLFKDRSNLCGGNPAYYNNHWGGYLGPVDGYVNGSHFYLNKPNLICLTTFDTN